MISSISTSEGAAMKTFAWAVVWGIVVCGGLSAGPVYQINFTGTITSGKAMDFNLATNGFDQVADLAGRTVSGWMRFDLGLAPAATVNTDAPSGIVTTAIQGNAGPLFVSEFLDLGPIPLSVDYIPLPATFSQNPIPTFSIPTNVQAITNQQSLQVTSRPDGTSQSILPQMGFNDTFDNVELHESNLVTLVLLVTRLQQFFSVPTAGDLPSNWTETGGLNGVFNFSLLQIQNNTTQDAAHHFGVTTDYGVSGSFTIDSASGGFVDGATVPEPGTLVLAGVALLALVSATSARRRKL